MAKPIQLILLVFLLTTIFSSCSKQENNETIALEEEFINPPNEAKPRVWWHWMNGNVTKDGIRKDLEWINQTGIGGFQNFDAGMTTPQIVDKRLVYMTPEWKDAFFFTTQLADSLNMEMAIAGSPGWSESGGPWVPAEDGMKKLVWTTIQVQGEKPVLTKLPKAPSVTGAFQNLAAIDEISMLSGESPVPPSYYEDVAVLAYKIPSSHIPLKDLNPKITSSGGKFTVEQLTDGDINKTSLLPVNKQGEFAWIQFEFPQEQTIKAISIVGGESGGIMSRMMGGGAETRTLEASSNGKDFSKVTNLPVGELPQLSLNIEPTTAKYFRISYKNPAPMPTTGMDLSIFGLNLDTEASKGTEIAEIVLFPNAIIDRFEEKAGYVAYSEEHPLTKAATEDAINPDEIFDITDKLTEDGTLEWTPPAGNWKIIRYGFSLTGKQNHPASFEATGLEVDKMDAEAVTRYFENYLNQYKDATQGMMGARGLQYIITDSYEAGQANWTPTMIMEFEKRRGYSMIPWMPAITGKIVQDADASEKFLFDFRKTIGELIAENHYDNLTDILDKYGMKRYTESHENQRVYIVDGMDVKRTAAVPMSACWVGSPFGAGQTMHEADIRESASVAHIYGQNLVAAESLTAMGMAGNALSYHPGNLKPTADLELASGLNRFVIHTSVHQPVDDKVPGLSLSIFGQWFTRHETWADQAKTWIDYLSRSSYLLQQGEFVADVVYYYGEDNNITKLFGRQLPDIPASYAYDFINPHALINLLQVEDGKLITPSGMSYRLLYLDQNAKKMSVTVLRKISELVKSGAVIGGTKPEIAPGLEDDIEEFNKLVAEVWDSNNPNVYQNKSVEDVLNILDIKPDFSAGQNNENIMYVHRTLPGSEIYWVNNRNENELDINATFRVDGMEAEIWDPATGEMTEVSYNITDGLTTVPMHLAPNDALFVVFRNKTKEKSKTIPSKTEQILTTVEGPWTVAFQEERGAPSTMVFETLTPWNENDNFGVKYFSGTASYSKTINAPSGWFNSGNELWLDLGSVQNLAEVIINGKSLGVVWKAPYKLSVTDALKEGDNNIEIKVTNVWVNRIIGDLQSNTDKKYTWTAIPYYRANSPLKTSGLLGPVVMINTK